MKNFKNRPKRRYVFRLTLMVCFITYYPFFATHGFTPKNTEKNKNKLPDKARKFIPKNYSILDFRTGDLNKDSYSDLILILKQDREDTSNTLGENELKRLFIILTGQKDKSYKKAIQNNNLLYCVHCAGMGMSDPYGGVTIDSGSFSIEQDLFRTINIATFTCDSKLKKWLLNDMSNTYISNGEGDTIITYNETITAKERGIKCLLDTFNIDMDLR